MDDERDLATSAETYYATPTLMRAARGAYAGSIRAQLHEAGLDDLPRNGAFILSGIADTADAPRTDLPGDLGVTKQAVSQLIDILATRGYVVRNPDPGDRRRISLELTDRGQAAVAAVRRGVEAVDRQLGERIPPEQVEAMRSALLALAQIKTAGQASGAVRGRPARQLRRFCPIFEVRDLAAALALYASLGFRTLAHEEGDEYGFANRDGVGLHLELSHGHDDGDAHGHHHHGSAYLYVVDADALYAEWSRPGIGGVTHHVITTGYEMREGSHTDPDGNVIRFGSAIEETASES
jgi:DNA-binding MarR family transcriptional regulator/catechol 2,3-dioxygenase-like lactoylglutathione lyase family enzyme